MSSKSNSFLASSSRPPPRTSPMDPLTTSTAGTALVATTSSLPEHNVSHSSDDNSTRRAYLATQEKQQGQNVESEKLFSEIKHQSMLCASMDDKLVAVSAIMTFKSLGKVVVHVQSKDFAYKLKLLLDQHARRSALIHTELPKKCVEHIIKHYNGCAFETLIVADMMRLEEDLGITLIFRDFYMLTVIHLDMPTPVLYTRSVRRVRGRKEMDLKSILLVLEDEQAALRRLKLQHGLKNKMENVEEIVQRVAHNMAFMIKGLLLRIQDTTILSARLEHKNFEEENSLILDRILAEGGRIRGSGLVRHDRWLFRPELAPR